MRRILIGAMTSLAVWLGSALAAEAQGSGITPTGPTAYLAGSVDSTYKATIYLPTPLNFKVNTQVYLNGVLQIGFSQYVPNPGVNTSTFSQDCPVNFGVIPGDVVTYKAQLYWNRTITNAPDFSVTVTGTRPPLKSDSIKKRTGPIAKGMAIQSVNADRRREE